MDEIRPEDYTEPACPLCMDKTDALTSGEIGRMIDKLDRYLSRDDYEGAERHLLYWLSEAGSRRDERAELTIRNEMMGLYRKLGRKDEAIACAERALALMDADDQAASPAGGTTLVNAATVFKAFGDARRALPLYKKALEIYTAALSPDDPSFGGLYNNMALALTDTGDYDAASSYFHRAIEVMEKHPGSEPEQAISCLNLADLAVARDGPDKADKEVVELLDRAEVLLDTEGLPRDGNYAFVCDKCASVFEYYGYFLYSKELKKRSGEIYAGA